MGIITTLMFIYLLKRENRLRDEGVRDERILGDEKAGGNGNGSGGTYASVDEARREKGDMWSGYRYIL